MDNLAAQIQATEGITEKLKAADPMEWVGAMSNVSAGADEIIREELIFI